MFKAVCFIVILLINVFVYAQSFPVSTTSKEAKKIFLDYGWDNAFNFQDKLHFETMDKLISLDSTFALAYLHRGGYGSDLYNRKQYFELARQNEAHISEDEKKLMDAFYAFAWDYDQLKAAKILQELADKYPNQPHFPAYIGIRYWNLGEFAKAIPYFEEALKRDPDFAPAYHLLGAMYLRLKEFEPAEKNFKMYKQKYPELWMPDYNLGILYLRQDKLSEAEHYFQRAIAMDSSAEARDNIGYNYLLQGHLDKAKALFEENLEEHPNDPNVYSSMGDWFFEQNEFRKAAQWYKKAQSYDLLNTSARNYYRNMVEAYIIDGHQAIKEAVLAGDSEQFTQLFTFNATIITTDGKLVKGTSHINDYFKSQVDRDINEIKLSNDKLICSKDEFFATDYGRLELTKENGATINGYYTAIWRNSSDGWKIDNVSYIINHE